RPGAALWPASLGPRYARTYRSSAWGDCAMPLAPDGGLAGAKDMPAASTVSRSPSARGILGHESENGHDVSSHHRMPTPRRYEGPAPFRPLGSRPCHQGDQETRLFPGPPALLGVRGARAEGAHRG